MLEKEKRKPTRISRMSPSSDTIKYEPRWHLSPQKEPKHMKFYFVCFLFFYIKNMVYILIWILFLWMLFLYRKIETEKLKNSIIQSFMAGIIRATSDYCNWIVEDESFHKEFRSTTLPITYENILDNICLEFSKNYYVSWELIKNKKYDDFLKNNRLLFLENDKYSDNRWFHQIYLDFFDRYTTQWINK